MSWEQSKRLSAASAGSDVPPWWYGQAAAVENHGPGLRPTCRACGLVKGIKFMSGGMVVQADPEPHAPFVSDGYCSTECMDSDAEAP